MWSRIFSSYLVLVSCLMIFQVVYYEIHLLMDWNVNAWMIENHPKQSRFLFQALEYLFFFTIYNIPVCLISGIILLIKRHFKIAALCLGASVLYCVLLNQIGNFV